MNQNNLLLIREARGLTQKQLAEKSGVPLSVINACENFKRALTNEQEKKIAAALKVSENWFICSPTIVDNSDAIFYLKGAIATGKMSLQYFKMDQKFSVFCFTFSDYCDKEGVILRDLSSIPMTVKGVLDSNFPLKKITYADKKFASKVEFLIKRSGKNKGEVASDCDVSVGELQQLIAGKRQRSFSFLTKLSYSLSCSYSLLVDDFQLESKSDYIQFFMQLVLSGYEVKISSPNKCIYVGDKNLIESVRDLQAYSDKFYTENGLVYRKLFDEM